MSTTANPVEDPRRLAGSREWKLLIGGELCDASDGGVRATVDPSTGRPTTDVPEATAEDVRAAVTAAAEAQPSWQALGVRGRAEVFSRLADAVRESREELALLDAIDCGNPVGAMRTDVDISIRNILDWPGLALALNGETIDASPGNLHYTLHEPYGVVGKILAFNHPGMFAMTRILAPLIMGNTVVLKPGEQTPLSALAFGQIVRGILPPGVLNVLSGGAEAGDALVTHPDVKRLGFTGSVPTGRLIQQRAATVGVKHLSLELGGKNAMMVFPDVNIDRVVASAREGMNLEVCQGQSCGSTSRIFLHESVYDEFAERYAAELSSLRLGPAYDERTSMGPLVSAEHHDRVTGYVAAGEDEGATLLVGGRRPAGVDDGFFLEPAVFGDVDPAMRIAQEEIFGPVVSLFRWSDYDELLEQVNAVEHGLTASIWTDNIHVAHKTAQHVQAGYVWINDSTKHYWGTPFGGYKNSGLGREESTSELVSYAETKAVHTILREAEQEVGDMSRG